MNDECLRWSTISALNYNEIKKKEFENIFKKIKHEDKDFLLQQRDWKNFASQNSEEIMLVYKSEQNFKRENAQNALNGSLDYQRSKKEPQKISELKPYINQYNWKGLKSPSDKEDWKKFEQHNKEIALNILFVPHNKAEIIPEYISKYKHKSKNQVVLLMITDDGE